MFYRKQIDKLIGSIDKFFDTIDQGLLVFSEGVKNYLYNHADAFSSNLQAIKRVIGMSDKPLTDE